MRSKYQSTLKYMFEQLPMYQRQGTSAFKKDLKNIITLTKHLNSPQDNFKSIHIAGTNGKGSISHIIAAGLQAHGLKVGVYTSPHYIDFRERIKINGKLISAKYVIRFVERHKAVFERIKPSFFEMTVAMAFEFFSKEQVDVAVIEVGLGGRLDSTNVITPILSVISNISLDHQSMLGNTLTKIAFEKAGIIKNSVPALIGERQPKVEDIFLKKSKFVKTEIIFADEIISLKRLEETKDTVNFLVSLVKENQQEIISSDLIGPHQTKNIKTSLAALYLLRKKLNLDWSIVLKSMDQVRDTTHYIGRWQLIGTRPFIVADSAHNVAGLKEVVDRVDFISKGNIHFVLGFVNDKQLSSILSLFPSKAKFYFVKANVPRGLPADQLKEIAKLNQLKGKVYSTVRRGLAAAKKCATREDTIFIGGSIFVVAEVL